mgnify:CR=1 FL=1
MKRLAEAILMCATAPACNKGMSKQTSLMATIGQYPSELLSLFGGTTISDKEGAEILSCIKLNKAAAGSDGSVKDGKGGHAFCITDNEFTTQLWGFAPTVGSDREMSSLRAEHGGALGILLLLHPIYTHFEADYHVKMTIFIDNAEVIRRGKKKVPKLGVKQHLVLDYGLSATTERLQAEMACNIQWEWVKGHQIQGFGSK